MKQHPVRDAFCGEALHRLPAALGVGLLLLGPERSRREWREKFAGHDAVNRDQAHWVRQAACAGRTAVMFPEPHDRAAVEAAQVVCASCEVVDDCLAYAVDRRERNGVWGGKLFDRQRKRGQRPKPLVPCPECGLQLEDGAGMANHIRSRHPLVPCPECGLDVEQGALAAHVREQHPPARRWCPWCSGSFPDVEALRRHVRTRHPAPKPTCPRAPRTTPGPAAPQHPALPRLVDTSNAWGRTLFVKLALVTSVLLIARWSHTFTRSHLAAPGRTRDRLRRLPPLSMAAGVELALAAAVVAVAAVLVGRSPIV